MYQAFNMLFSTVKLGILTWKSLEPALSGPARKLQFLALCTGFIFVFQDWKLPLVIHTQRLITWFCSFLNSHILSHVKVPFQTHIIVTLRITIPKRTNCAFIHADLIPCQCTGCTSNSVTGISAGMCLATSGAKKNCVPCPSCTLKDVMNMCSWSQKTPVCYVCAVWVQMPVTQQSADTCMTKVHSCWPSSSQPVHHCHTREGSEWGPHILEQLCQ